MQLYDENMKLQEALIRESKAGSAAAACGPGHGDAVPLPQRPAAAAASGPARQDPEAQAGCVGLIVSGQQLLAAVS